MSAFSFSLLGGIIFTIGIFIVLLRKNFLFVLMGLEVMLNGVNVVLVGFTRISGNLQGQGLALLILAIGASEVAVGLGIAMNLVRVKLGLDLDLLGKKEEEKKK